MTSSPWVDTSMASSTRERSAAQLVSTSPTRCTTPGDTVTAKVGSYPARCWSRCSTVTRRQRAPTRRRSKAHRARAGLVAYIVSTASSYSTRCCVRASSATSVVMSPRTRNPGKPACTAASARRWNTSTWRCGLNEPPRYRSSDVCTSSCPLPSRASRSGRSARSSSSASRPPLPMYSSRSPRATPSRKYSTRAARRPGRSSYAHEPWSPGPRPTAAASVRGLPTGTDYGAPRTRSSTRCDHSSCPDFCATVDETHPPGYPSSQRGTRMTALVVALAVLVGLSLGLLGGGGSILTLPCWSTSRGWTPRRRSPHRCWWSA